jgi:hypothetical protein
MRTPIRSIASLVVIAFVVGGRAHAAAHERGSVRALRQSRHNRALDPVEIAQPTLATIFDGTQV